MTLISYKKTIAKLLKAYHKKYDCFGKEVKKPTKRKRRK